MAASWLAATSPTCRARRAWNLRGASASELLAEVPHESRARVKVGGLVGILSDASEHWVGMIRRLHAQPDGALHAHIEVLSRAPRRTLRQVFGKDEDRPYTEAASSNSA